MSGVSETNAPPPSALRQAIKAGFYPVVQRLIDLGGASEVRSLEPAFIVEVLNNQPSLAVGRVAELLLAHGMPMPRYSAFQRDEAGRIIGVAGSSEAIGQLPWSQGPWTLNPLIDGPWQTLSAAESAACLATCLAYPEGLNLHTVERLKPWAARRLDLGFYEQGSLIEFAVHTDQGMGALTLLQVGRHVAWLDGKSWPIHRINSQVGLKLRDADDAALYMTMFCAALDSGEGTFRLLSRFDLISWEAGADKESQDKVRSLCTPPVVVPSEEEGFQFDGRILYLNGVFEVRMAVQPSGMVKVPAEALLATDLPGRHEPFVDNVRMLVSRAPGEQQAGEPEADAQEA